MDPENGKGQEFFESIDMPDDTYCFKTDFTDGEYGVNAVFEDSRYFDSVEENVAETKYEAPGITVRVENFQCAVEYAVDSHGQEHSQAVQEFVDGVVHSIEDVTPEFREDIENEIYNRAIADGGKETGMPYGGSVSTVENVSESSDFMGDYPM